MSDDEKEMELIRELASRCNDDELHRVWYLLTGIMLAKRPKADLMKAFE